MGPTGFPALLSRNGVAAKWLRVDIACYGVILGVFASSRVLVGRAGVRFDISPLDYYYQYIDPRLLTDRLLESLLFLHGQPPLFNLFLGLVLKVGGRAPPGLFHAIYLGLGLSLAFLMYGLCRHLNVGRGLALAGVSLAVISPSFILNENELIYTLPVAALMLVCVHSFSGAIVSGNSRGLLVSFMAIALLVGMRSSYHLALLVAVMLYSWLVVGRSVRRKVLVASAIPLILASSFYVKNVIIFGRFTTSTWLGMNLWHVTAQALPPERREALVQDGLLEISDRHSFLPLGSYPTWLWVDAQASCAGPPVLCAREKSTGATNFNHIAYIRISDTYLRDDLYALRHEATIVLRRALSGIVHYYWPGSTFEHLATNRETISTWNAVWERYVYGRAVIPGRTESPEWSRYWFPNLIAANGVAMAWAMGALVRSIGRMGGKRTGRGEIALGMIGLLLVYSIVVSNAFEYGENMRFRAEVEPLSIVALLAAIASLSTRLMRAAGGRSNPSSAQGSREGEFRSDVHTGEHPTNNTESGSSNPPLSRVPGPAKRRDHSMATYLKCSCS